MNGNADRIGGPLSILTLNAPLLLFRKSYDGTCKVVFAMSSIPLRLFIITADEGRIS
jgi:hypothetical protein